MPQFLNINLLLLCAASLAAALAYFLGMKRANALAANAFTGEASVALHSRPHYHGWFAAILVGGPALFLTLVFIVAGRPGALLSGALALAAAAAGGVAAARLIAPGFRARVHVETFVRSALFLCSAVAVLTTAGIIFSLLFESFRFFEKVSALDFLTGLQWSPQIALRADQAGQSGAFGAVPVFAGTLVIMAVALLVAAPVGLLIAFYLSEYASKTTRAYVKPLIEMLAGVPTVVYGFFALLTVGPAIRAFAGELGFSVPTQSAIAAGSVMGVMIIPFISSLSDDVINAVPQSLRDGAYALGATKSETLMQVVFPAALPGVVSAILLAVSRAIGETMIVVMAAGRAANLSANPFDAMTTVTVQIVALLTGDQEFDSPKTLAAFALGLILFIVTLALNVVALVVVRRYREKFE